MVVRCILRPKKIGRLPCEQRLAVWAVGWQGLVLREVMVSVGRCPAVWELREHRFVWELHQRLH